jgi:PadR family transcriptional regulator, regulatory protein PadR
MIVQHGEMNSNKNTATSITTATTKTVYVIRSIYIYRMTNILWYYIMRRFSGDNNNYCCDMRGMLGFLILFLLSKKPMHGQEIADEIARRKGEKPSPGTIYPALKNLREMGFILSDEKEGKTITYAITDRGKNALRISKRRFIRTFLGVFP